MAGNRTSQKTSVTFISEVIKFVRFITDFPDGSADRVDLFCEDACVRIVQLKYGAFI